MKWYGSLTNRLEENAKPKNPVVGDGVTEYCYSDRHAYTVVVILSPTKIAITRDNAIRLDSNGQSESQNYKFETCWKDMPIILRKNKYGKWKMIGDSQGSTYVVGIREEYDDPCF
jgi:hypothetical protein